MTKLTTLTLAALTVASISTPVFAADAPQAAGSTGHVIVDAGDDKTPTDPTDPDDKPGTGNTGLLTLDAVPSLDFGHGSIDKADKAFDLVSVNGKGVTDDAGDTGKNSKTADVQVTDKRATGEGWTVFVQYGTVAADRTTVTPTTDTDDAWVDGTDKTLKLKGVKLVLPTAAAAWTLNGDDVTTDGAPVGDADVTVSGAAAKVATADTDKGMGTWLGRMAADATKLTIPQGNKKGDYTANLVWTMAATPQV